MMKPKIKKDWVDALRSGHFEQGKGMLYDQGKYCCLGVLCKIQNGTVRTFCSFLTDDELIRFNLKEEQQIDLSNMNDGVQQEQKNFNEIADYIEKNL